MQQQDARRLRYRPRCSGQCRIAAGIKQCHPGDRHIRHLGQAEHRRPCALPQSDNRYAPQVEPRLCRDGGQDERQMVRQGDACFVPLLRVIAAEACLQYRVPVLDQPLGIDAGSRACAIGIRQDDDDWCRAVRPAGGRHGQQSGIMAA
ncbi:hypothetical protein CKO45_01110 [Paracraurococcus ruber]|uniref:Uncharacterized protein n=1 Tax=Paracraurococcus ruber TaxID=77675 RepID=A0ABS1CR55_9PROT|nr:hypothetical protein [Paracraurococcus ruber]